MRCRLAQTEKSEFSVFSAVTILKLGTRSMLFQEIFNLHHKTVSYFSTREHIAFSSIYSKPLTAG